MEWHLIALAEKTSVRVASIIIVGVTLSKGVRVFIICPGILKSRNRRGGSQSMCGEGRAVLPIRRGFGYRWAFSSSARNFAESAFKDLTCACKTAPSATYPYHAACREKGSSHFHTSVSILPPPYQKPCIPYNEALAIYLHLDTVDRYLTVPRL